MSSRFNLFVESILPTDSPQLSPGDLYKFYFLNTLHSLNRLSGQFASFIVEEFIFRLKERYLIIFDNLLYTQIAKYINRKRHDSEVSTKELNRAKETSDNKLKFELYNSLMNKTYRSDMKRRNDVWNLITKYCLELSNSSSVKSIFFYIDRLNNCVHNTKEIILVKFPNGHALLGAFDKIHNIKSLNEYIPLVPKDYRELLNI